MSANTWTSNRRLYLDKDGKVVEATDPTRATLLVVAGGSIPLADAQRYGLLSAPQGTPEGDDEKAAAPAAENKLARPASENKGSMVGEPVCDDDEKNVVMQPKNPKK